MHQKFSVGCNGVVPVRSLRKIPMRLRGTNLCTSSARFAPSFVRQPNGPECTRIVRNAPKCQFRVQWGGSGVFVAKNSDATSWHELLHYFGPFCTEFCKATKRSRMHPNSLTRTKMSVLGQMGWIGCSLRKIPTRHPGTNFGTSSARFTPSFVRQPSGLEYTQIVLNHQNISLGSNGEDRVHSFHKIPTRLHGTNFCTSSERFAPSFVWQPNGPECTQIV